MNRDGSDVRNLSDHPDFDGYPTFSPDGSWVAFASNRDGNTPTEFNLYLVDLNGEHLTQLTETITGVEQVRPAFCTDGKRIVFNRDWPDGRVEIHILEVEY